jgi:hypothetical protein
LREVLDLLHGVPISHVNRVVNGVSATESPTSTPSWSRFRCRPVSAWLQVDPGPSGEEFTVDTVGA